MKYWKIIADNLSKAGWSWGCVSAVDSRGRTLFVVDAHRDNGKRFIVCADEKLTAFFELESARFEILGNELLRRRTQKRLVRQCDVTQCFGFKRHETL